MANPTVDDKEILKAYKVPTLEANCKKLGLDSTATNELRQASKRWRANFRTRDGNPGTSLVKWKGDGVQDELRCMAIGFLNDEEIKKTFWSGWDALMDRESLITILIQILYQHNRSLVKSIKNKEKLSELKSGAGLQERSPNILARDSAAHTVFRKSPAAIDDIYEVSDDSEDPTFEPESQTHESTSAERPYKKRKGRAGYGISDSPRITAGMGKSCVQLGPQLEDIPNQLNIQQRTAHQNFPRGRDSPVAPIANMGTESGNAEVPLTSFGVLNATSPRITSSDESWGPFGGSLTLEDIDQLGSNVQQTQGDYQTPYPFRNQRVLLSTEMNGEGSSRHQPRAQMVSNTTRTEKQIGAGPPTKMGGPERPAASSDDLYDATPDISQKLAKAQEKTPSEAMGPQSGNTTYQTAVPETNAVVDQGKALPRLPPQNNLPEHNSQNSRRPLFWIKTQTPKVWGTLWEGKPLKHMTLSVFLEEISTMSRCPKRSAVDIDQITLYMEGPMEMKARVPRGDEVCWESAKRELETRLKAARKRGLLDKLDIWFEPIFGENALPFSDAVDKDEDEGGFDF